MAGVPQSTLNWLWGVLQREYRDPQRAYSDLAQLLAQHPAFAPETQVYTSEHGTSALLIHLTGTIPVNYRGAPYRCPLAIWVPHAYPYESPTLFVTPTSDMMIRPGQHVSPSDGRIYHPYLAGWRDAWQRSNMVDFIHLLADIFAREPPVRSRQQAPGQQPSRGPPPPRPAPPPSFPGSPPPPPKPAAPPNESRSTPDLQRPTPSRYDVPPPLPGQLSSPRPTPMMTAPPQMYAPQAQYEPQRQPSLRQNYTGGQQQQQQQQQQPPPLSSQSQYQPQRQSIAGPPAQALPPQQYGQRPQSSYQQQQQMQPHPPPSHNPQAYPTQQQQQYQPQPQPPKPKPQEPNLMDESPFDVTLSTTRPTNLPTPAIPPNPEKQHILSSLQSSLLHTLHSQISQSNSALPALQSQHSALLSSQQILQAELSHLQSLYAQLQQNVSSLTSTISSADRTISNAQAQASPDKIPNIDELIIPPNVVSRQLYDSVAEQRGYEAAIYALTDGFVRGRIGSDLWARKTRECAREEFRKKWLVKRVGRGMALDMSGMDG